MLFEKTLFRKKRAKSSQKYFFRKAPKKHFLRKSVQKTLFRKAFFA